MDIDTHISRAPVANASLTRSTLSTVDSRLYTTLYTVHCELDRSVALTDDDEAHQVEAKTCCKCADIDSLVSLHSTLVQVMTIAVASESDSVLCCCMTACRSTRAVQAS